MLCFYDLSEVPVIVFPAISQNFRNEVVPLFSERQVCLVHLYYLVFPVCFFFKPGTSAHKPCHFNGAWYLLWCLNTRLWARNKYLLVGWFFFFLLGISFALYCFLVSFPLSQDSSRDMKWQLLFWAMILGTNWIALLQKTGCQPVRNGEVPWACQQEQLYTAG